MSKTAIWEARPLNERSSEGRLQIPVIGKATIRNIINAQRQLTSQIFVCCSRAFLTETAFKQHQQDCGKAKILSGQQSNVPSTIANCGISVSPSKPRPLYAVSKLKKNSSQQQKEKLVTSKKIPENFDDDVPSPPYADSDHSDSYEQETRQPLDGNYGSSSATKTTTQNETNKTKSSKKSATLEKMSLFNCTLCSFVSRHRIGLASHMKTEHLLQTKTDPPTDKSLLPTTSQNEKVVKKRRNRKRSFMFKKKKSHSKKIKVAEPEADTKEKTPVPIEKPSKKEERESRKRKSEIEPEKSEKTIVNMAEAESSTKRKRGLSSNQNQVEKQTKEKMPQPVEVYTKERKSCSKKLKKLREEASESQKSPVNNKNDTREIISKSPEKPMSKEKHKSDTKKKLKEADTKEKTPVTIEKPSRKEERQSRKKKSETEPEKSEKTIVNMAEAESSSAKTPNERKSCSKKRRSQEEKTEEMETYDLTLEKIIEKVSSSSKKKDAPELEENEIEKTVLEEDAPLECSPCGLKFESATNLKRHKQMCHSEFNKFNCRHCPATFRTEVIRECHETVFHASNMKGYIIISNRSQKRDPECNNVCKLCTNAFKLRASLLVHAKLAHAPNGEFLCELCCNFEIYS